MTPSPKRFASTVVSLLLPALLCGCFHAGFRPDAEAALADGWTLYAAGQFEEALAAFEEAETRAASLEDDLLRGRAYNGMGWSRLRMSDDETADAFELAIELLGEDAEAADALAGRAGWNLSDDRPGAARRDARDALELAPAFESFHDPIDAADLDAIVLLSLLQQGNLDRAATALDRIDPDNGLDPDDPSTWMVDGVPQPTYTAAFLRACAAATN